MYENERYKFVYVDGKKVPEHVLVWERAHGPKPQGCDIHHIDGNGKNNALENLVCLTKSEHKTLHARLKREGRDVIDSTDPVIIKSRAMSLKNAKTHRQEHLEEERAKDRDEYQRNKERELQINHSYYQRHREEIRSAQAEYERQHTEERAKRNSEYYAQHTEERKQYEKEYRAAHREEVAAKKKEYAAAHAEEIKAYRAAYRAVHAANERLRKAILRGLPEETVTQFREQVAKAKLEFQEQRSKKGQ